MDNTHCSIDTLAVHGATPFDPVTGAISSPIYLSSTFRHPALGETTGFDYSRESNPTRLELERTVAALENAKHGLAFASGMGAISAVLKLFKPGDHIVVSEDLYGGTYRLFKNYYTKYGVRFSWVDTSNPRLLTSSIRPDTKALFIETPSNPMMKVTDIRLCASLIHKQDGFLIVDNTFLSPYYQNPLELGGDIVVHSGTKYLGGHNDALAGFIALSRDDLAEELRMAQKSEGATLSPFDAWLILRGIKTLGVRMDRHSGNALEIAKWLRTHPRVHSVFYTGFSDHPQFEISAAQSRGHSGMVSFYVNDPEDAPKVLKNVELILFAESLGGVETLLTYPIVQTHSAIPEAMRNAAGVDERLLRLSVGIEYVDDLIKDLDRALSW